MCIALLGLLTLGQALLNGLAFAAAITVACTVLAAVTLLPALFGVLGLRVLSRRQRRRLRTGGPDAAGSGAACGRAGRAPCPGSPPCSPSRPSRS